MTAVLYSGGARTYDPIIDGAGNLVYREGIALAGGSSEQIAITGSPASFMTGSGKSWCLELEISSGSSRFAFDSTPQALSTDGIGVNVNDKLYVPVVDGARVPLADRQWRVWASGAVNLSLAIWEVTTQPGSFRIPISGASEALELNTLRGLNTPDEARACVIYWASGTDVMSWTVDGTHPGVDPGPVHNLRDYGPLTIVGRQKMDNFGMIGAAGQFVYVVYYANTGAFRSMASTKNPHELVRY